MEVMKVSNRYLVLPQQSDEHLDLFLCDSVHDFSVVSDQFYDHLGNVQADVPLKNREYSYVISYSRMNSITLKARVDAHVTSIV